MYPGLPSSFFYDSHGEYVPTDALATYNCEQHSGQIYHLPASHLIPSKSSIEPLPRPDYIGVDATVVYVGSVEFDNHIKKVPMVARVSIIDYQGNLILDTYVHPTHYIEDYRTQATGLKPNDLVNAPYFEDVQFRVAGIIKNKILVGHSLWNFLSVLGLSHPALYTRDLALYRPLRKQLKSKLVVSLPTLAHIYMRRDVGLGYENSVRPGFFLYLSLPVPQWSYSDGANIYLSALYETGLGLATSHPQHLQQSWELWEFKLLFLTRFMDVQAIHGYSSFAPNNIGQSLYQIEQPSGEPSSELSLSDSNSWYYPSHGYDLDDEDLERNLNCGNWGNKMIRGARWVRRGKMTSWGPSMDDWKEEERARKRIKRLLPPERRSQSPPNLPHLERSPSPPLVSPYPPPDIQHLSYASFVMDKSVTHTFRSNLLDELEHATNGLIEGEASMRRALGRLWQVMSEDPDDNNGGPPLIPKQEDEDAGTGEGDDRAQRMARAPDLTSPIHKLFLLSYPEGGPQVFEPSHFASPETQLESLEKSMATLRELEDDGREYIERLTELREGIGEVRAQRDGIWDMVRERAIKEFQEEAALNGDTL